MILQLSPVKLYYISIFTHISIYIYSYIYIPWGGGELIELWSGYTFVYTTAGRTFGYTTRNFSSVRPSVRPSFRLSVIPSVRHSVRPSVCLSVLPSVRPSVYIQYTYNYIIYIYRGSLFTLYIQL